MHSDDNAPDAGHAKVVRFDCSEWKQVEQTVGAAKKDFYVCLADDGRTVAASAMSGSPSGKVKTEYVQMFTLDDSDIWVRDLDGESPNEQFS